ncbi:MAG: hypothetical protein WC867_04310 [Candidatus Pacearchaeota archaeon]|jgi:hypothetical protein
MEITSTLYEDSKISVITSKTDSNNYALYLQFPNGTFRYFDIPKETATEIINTNRDCLENKIDSVNPDIMKIAKSIGLISDSIGLALAHAKFEEDERLLRYISMMRKF